MATVPPRVLSIAGTDPLCGAGGVADAMVFARLGAQPLVVESALVEQDSCGVYGVFAVPIELFERQLRRAMRDASPRAVKIGLLPSAGHVRVVADALEGFVGAVVLDPVLAASGGAVLVDDVDSVRDAVHAALRRGWLVTPNARELGELTAAPTPATVAGARTLAEQLSDSTGAAVLAKGGHLEPRGVDLLVHDGVVRRYRGLRWAVSDIHGTGCHLSSAIAARLAAGAQLPDAVAHARRALSRWSGSAAQVGSGRRQFVHVRHG